MKVNYMTREYVPVDISNAPDLKRLAEPVCQTGQPHALKQGTETVAVVRPAPKKERRTNAASRPGRRSRVFTMDDPLWRIVGIARGAGPENVLGNVDAYLAEAYLDEQPLQ